MHGTPAGFPFGIPGKGVDIDGASQQAPHFLHMKCRLFGI